MTAANRVLRSEIVGSLKMKSCLSGMPELKLGLNDRLALQAAAASAGDSVSNYNYGAAAGESDTTTTTPRNSASWLIVVS